MARSGSDPTASRPGSLPSRWTAVDAIGAGDSFDAGFLAAWIDGQSLEAALRFGVACGSLSTRAAGGTDAQPTRAEAEAAVRGMGAS